MKVKIHTGNSINELHKLLITGKPVFVIIDDSLQHVAEHFRQFPLYFFKASEKRKTLESVVEIAQWLLDKGADRNALVLGVGGGITTDVTGFAASIYKRGVKFAFVPTTLLAQVDASIGGKNGVNFLSYKNILGTITQPEWIFICPQLLATLPENEFKAGIAEVLKTFILFDKEYYRKAVGYFSTIAPKDGETYGTAAVGLDGSLLAEIIGKCAKYKSEVVERDEFERGERRMLNLGHTFAHSIEKLAGGEISHGYAVSMGMVLAAKFADALCVAREGFSQMLINDLRSVGLPALLEDCPLTANFKPGDLAEAVGKDKKVTGNSIRFILPKGLQEVEDIQIPLDKIKEIADDLR